MRRIRALDPLVAQRIAAGEVIERPASVVRELLDNSIDAGASTITVQVVEGGIERITVIDDGEGIPSEELPLCCHSHTTSKVSSLDDLYNLSSLGFRGEALYSIAAGAKVTIASHHSSSTPATLIVDNGIDGELLPVGPDKGTRVDVENLFATLPARRLFLKRPSSEALMCRRVLIEKARAFPEIAFRFYEGEELKIDLPVTNHRQRVLDTLTNDKRVVAGETIEMKDVGGNFSLYAVASNGAYWRSDRSHIGIYVNNRPIDEYALVQAVSYGYGERLPGGAFPYFYLFVKVDPELVDFNIHPAKREAKLRNLAEIHQQVVAMIRSQLTTKELPKVEVTHQGEFFKGYSPPSKYTSPPRGVNEEPRESDWFERAKEIFLDEETPSFRYLGQLFSLFLIVEKDSSLYLIDQHAAHERLLYDQVRQGGGVQNLMLPIVFEVERSVDTFIQANYELYREWGLSLERKDELLWELTTIPASWKSIEGIIVDFLSSQTTGDRSELEKRLWATVACRAAVKDGDPITRQAAETLIEKVLQLENPVCPHGRIFVVEITKESLWRAVGRT
ncbi:MAG: DNA mismatch repair endonuclease MutL [Spirochaetales bacterium]|nr:DNA mismatch repair endonuclease MutL [Spirochaetales bacterium]